jgi:hypothetical protein
MVELLADRQWNSISIIKGATTCGEHSPLGTLPLCLLSPAITLEELKLGRASEDSRDAKHEGELNNRNPSLGARHQGPVSPGSMGIGKSTNSESAGSCRPNVRSARGTRI